VATSTKRQSYVAPVWRGLEHNIPIATGKPMMMGMKSTVFITP
jgi:hypothetical protein